jgi:hypothetical protein
MKGKEDENRRVGTRLPIPLNDRVNASVYHRVSRRVCWDLPACAYTWQ